VSGDVGLPDGFVLCALDSVASTNDEARRRAEAGAFGGLVITAREQTEGRGRYGRSWASPPGNLYASVLLRPDCPMAATAQLSLVAGLALAGALETLGPPGLDLKLKWPNDVLIGGAKAAGLLLEGAARSDGRAAWVIVGSGVNIASCPDGTPYPATSLREVGFAEVAPLAVLRAYLFALAEWLERWRDAGFEPVRKAWLERCMGLGGEIRLRLEREELSGRFVDLSETGALLLEQAGGRRRKIAAGDVFYLDY
jgi:BirA family transcriptional regulator, biotin operon repressor / biotin---[acetyl-CoA-carboxylase] ligase